MVIEYYGKQVSTGTIANYIVTIGNGPYYKGVAQETVVAAAKHYGFSVAT